MILSIWERSVLYLNQLVRKGSGNERKTLTCLPADSLQHTNPFYSPRTASTLVLSDIFPLVKDGISGI